MKHKPLIDIDQLRRQIGGEKPKSKSFIWNLVRNGKLPQPIRLGHRTVRWDQESIDQAIESMAAE